MEQFKNCSVLIVDDDVLIAETLKDMLIKLGFEKIKLSHSKEECLSIVKVWKPDMAILDIRMTGLYDGLEIGDYFKNVLNIPFMYVTAHSDLEMTNRIMATKPDGYITKPIRMNELMVNLSMVVSRLNELREERSVEVKNGNEIERVLVQDILYIKAEGNYVELVLTNKKMVIRNTLEMFLQELNCDALIRVHRSYAVNKLNIKKHSSSEVELENAVLPISRSYSAEIKNSLKI